MKLDDLIEKVLSLDAKATPRPWRHSSTKVIWQYDQNVTFREIAICGANPKNPRGNPQDDAITISTYRNEAPRLARACKVMWEALNKIAPVATDAANCIQVMKDGFEDENDPWPSLRTLRHSLRVHSGYDAIKQVEAIMNEGSGDGVVE